jgi:sugar/nucleoside kinase (ribokinase family)
MNLLVVGTVAFDDVETPFGRRERTLGGSATFFSYAASFFTSVGLVGAVGGDFPSEFVDLLAARDIDVSGLRTIAGEKTFFWAGKYLDDMNTRETIDTQLNVLQGYEPAIPAEFAATPFVFLANAEPRLQLHVIEQIDRPRFLVLDTMNLWIDTALDGLREAFSKVDAVIINDSEARMLTGERDIMTAAEKVLDMGPDTAIIKRGEYGAFLFSRMGKFAIPAYPVAGVFDPTGAGDSFAGGFMGYLAAQDSTDFAALKRAMVYGTVIASFNVEDFSLDRFRRLTREEIDARYEEFVSFISL